MNLGSIRKSFLTADQKADSLEIQRAALKLDMSDQDAVATVQNRIDSFNSSISQEARDHKETIVTIKQIRGE